MRETEDVIVGRSVESILAEWRALERDREVASRRSRHVLDARLEEQRDEYRVAMAAREAEARELRRRQ